jgi:hypothetical protein
VWQTRLVGNGTGTPSGTSGRPDQAFADPGGGQATSAPGLSRRDIGRVQPHPKRGIGDPHGRSLGGRGSIPRCGAKHLPPRLQGTEQELHLTNTPQRESNTSSTSAPSAPSGFALVE